MQTSNKTDTIIETTELHWLAEKAQNADAEVSQIKRGYDWNIQNSKWNLW
jgi:hypothetical protein